MSKNIKGYIIDFKILSKKTNKKGDDYKGVKKVSRYFNSKGNRIPKKEFLKQNDIKEKEYTFFNETYKKNRAIESFEVFKNRKDFKNKTNKELKEIYKNYKNDEIESILIEKKKKLKKPKEKKAYFEFLDIKQVENLDTSINFYWNNKPYDYIGLITLVNDLLANKDLPPYYKFILKIKVLKDNIYFKMTKNFIEKCKNEYDISEYSYTDFYENSIFFSTQDKKKIDKKDDKRKNKK